MTNIVRWSPNFKSKYNNKKRHAPKDIYARIQRALLELRNAPRPETLGEYKSGPLLGTLGYRVADDTRILYTVIRSNGVTKVILLRVCSHKKAYPPKGLTSQERGFTKGQFFEQTISPFGFE